MHQGTVVTPDSRQAGYDCKLNANSWTLLTEEYYIA